MILINSLRVNFHSLGFKLLNYFLWKSALWCTQDDHSFGLRLVVTSSRNYFIDQTFWGFFWKRLFILAFFLYSLKAPLQWETYFHCFQYKQHSEYGMSKFMSLLKTSILLSTLFKSVTACFKQLDLLLFSLFFLF